MTVVIQTHKNDNPSIVLGDEITLVNPCTLLSTVNRFRLFTETIREKQNNNAL